MEKMLMPGKATAAHAGAAASRAADAVPGKQTLAQQLPVIELAPEHVAPFKTKRFKEGGYEYEVTDEGAFAVVDAPADSKVAHGTLITRVKYPAAWHLLARLLLSLQPTTVSPTATTPAKVDEARPVEASEGDDAGDTEPAAPSIDTSGGDTFWIATPNCKLRKETGAAITPEQLIPQYSHVRVLEKKVMRDFTNAKIAKLDGTEIGWASFQHMIPLLRPARPSTAAAQMAAVLAAARSGHAAKQESHCYHFVKGYILGGGGYGDILDIQQDDRFIGNKVPAVTFHSTVQRLGPAAFDLESVGGLPAQAAPGTILVLRGTTKNGIDTVNGDISVIDNVTSRGVVRCYNDGVMELVAKESEWSGEGRFADSILGMYRPVDRK